MAVFRHAPGFALALALLALPTGVLAVSAPDTLTVTVSNTPIDLGKLVRSNATATTFTVTNGGAVSATASAGIRATSGNVSVLQFVLDCYVSTVSSKCTTGGKSYTFSITAGTPTGGGSIAKFTYGSITSNATANTASGSNPLTFTFSINNGAGNNWPVTVTLGYEYSVPTTAARGAASAPYTVSLTQN